MIPATAVPPSHSLNTLDRIAFYKSVREKRKQLQLNLHTNGKSIRLFSSINIHLDGFSPLFSVGKDDTHSSTENAFLTQMLQTPSNSTTTSSALNIPSLLRKGDFSSAASHRTVTSTLSNILPALLNGTLPSSSSTSNNLPNLHSPTSTNTTDTLVDMKCSTSLPVSPIANLPLESPGHHVVIPKSYSPPRCRSYPMPALSKRTSPLTSILSSAQNPPPPPVQVNVTSTSHSLATALSCPSLTTSTMNAMISSTSPSPDEIAPKIVRSASVKSCASDSGVSSSSPLSDNNIVHVRIDLFDEFDFSLIN